MWKEAEIEQRMMDKWSETQRLSYFLISICDGEQDTATPRGGFSDDSDCKVIVERVGDEWLCEAAHIGIRSKTVGRVTLEACDEGNGGGQGHADQLCQVQGSLRAAFCKKQNQKKKKKTQEIRITSDQ